MAGEFLQLLAHFARENKAERDADSRVIQNMVGRRMEESYDIAKTNNEREFALLNSDIAGSQTSLDALNKEIATYKAGLQGFGVTVNLYDDIDDVDKTVDAQDMMNVSLQRLNYESDDADFRQKSLVDRKAAQSRDLQKAEERRNYYRDKAQEWDNLNQSIHFTTKKLYNEEFDRYTADEAEGDLLLSKNELEVWKQNHQKEYDGWVEKYGGDNVLVDAKIQEVFKGFTKKDLKDLRDIEDLQTSEVNRKIKEQDELGADAVARKMFEQIDAGIDEHTQGVRSVVRVWGDNDVSKPAEQAFPFLVHTTDSDGPMVLADGSVVKPGMDSYFKLSQQRMMSVILAFQDEDAGGVGGWDGDKGLRYANDFELLAHYYTGQVRQITEDERVNKGLVSPYIELGYPEEWHTMFPVKDATEQGYLADRHVKEIGISKKDGSWFGVHDADLVKEAKASVAKFLWEFTESHKQYAKVKKAEQAYQMVSSNYESPFQAKVYSHAFDAHVPKNSSGEGRNALPPDENLRKQQDEKNEFDQAIAELNLDGSPDVMNEWARARGHGTDVKSAIKEYFTLGDTAAERKREDAKVSGIGSKPQPLTHVYAPQKSSGGQRQTEAERRAETFIEISNDPTASGSMTEAASIALEVKSLEPLLEKAYKDFLHQGGDKDKQYFAQKLWMNNGEKGYKTAAINQMASELLKELEVRSQALKKTDPKGHETIEYWIQRFRGIFTFETMDKYKKGSKYSEQWDDLIFDVYPDLVRPD